MVSSTPGKSVDLGQLVHDSPPFYQTRQSFVVATQTKISFLTIVNSFWDVSIYCFNSFCGVSWLGFKPCFNSFWSYINSFWLFLYLWASPLFIAYWFDSNMNTQSASLEKWISLLTPVSSLPVPRNWVFLIQWIVFLSWEIDSVSEVCLWWSLNKTKSEKSFVPLNTEGTKTRRRFLDLKISFFFPSPSS